MACARLHNFIIDHDCPNVIVQDDEEEQIIPMPNSPCGMAYMPMMIEEDDLHDMLDGFSTIRSELVKEIERTNLRRPNHNLFRAAIENQTNIEQEFSHHFKYNVLC